MPRPRPILLVVLLLAATVFRSSPMAYVTNGVKWNHSPVTYYVNPVNLDLPQSSVIAAVRAGADTWALQSAASFRFDYAGTSTQTTNTFDSVNLVMFRNASSGSAIATAYWWSNGSNILDADIVFWDGGFRFYSGTSGCSIPAAWCWSTANACMRSRRVCSWNRSRRSRFWRSAARACSLDR